MSDIAPSQSRNSIWTLAVAGLMLVAAECNLVQRILFKTGAHHEPWNFAIPVLIVCPFLVGLVLRRRMKALELSGDVSPRAAVRINSDMDSLIFITSCVFLVIAVSW